MKRLLLLALLGCPAVGLWGQSLQAPLLVTTINGISSSWPGECGPNVIDNRSSVSRQNTYHSVSSQGSGSWSVTLQFSNTACSGPWSSYGSQAAITQATNPPVAYAFDNPYTPAKFVKVLITGNAIAVYTGQHGLYLSTTSGSVSFPIDWVAQVGNKPVVDIRQFGTNSAAFTAAVTAAADGVLLVQTPISLTANATVPDNVALWCINDGEISVDSGHTLIVNGSFEGDLSQHFAGSGIVTLNNTPAHYVQWWGAKGDGATDNAGAVSATCASVATSSNSTVFFPEGNWYLASTPTCTGTFMSFRGAGVPSTNIILAAGAYVVDDDVQWINFSFRDIKVTGGAGVIRSRFTGAFSNASKYDVVNFLFFGFTKAAISAESSDEPMWEIRNGNFYGDPTVDTTMGVALRGDVSSVLLDHLTFQNTQVSVKFKPGGRAIVRDCNATWTVASVGRPRAGIWLVPSDANAASLGVNVTNWSNGNEFIESGDVRALLADEGTGTYFGDRFWVTTASTGYIGGFSMAGNFAGAGNIQTPVVYSYTPNVFDSNFGPFVFAGGMANWILQFDSSVPITPPGNGNTGNTFGPFQMSIWPGQAFQHFEVSNLPGYGETVDPGNEFVLQDYHQQFSNMMASFVTPLQTVSLPSFAPSNGATLAPITDVLGGDQAVEVTYPGVSAGIVAGSNIVPAVGIPVWLEFDLKAGSASSLSIITAVLQTNVGIVMERLITVPAAADGWRTFRMKWVPTTLPGVTNLGSLFVNTNGQGLLPVAGKVQIGRVRMYQSWEPVSGAYFFGRTAFGSSITSAAITGILDGNTGTLDLSPGTGGLKIKDQGTCTMTAGLCSAQTLGHTYLSAPTCFGNSNGTGTLTGILSIPSTTTAVTPTSSINTDTAHVNWFCLGQ